MMHVILGMFFIALGIWGIFDEWYYVIDCVKGGVSLFLIVVGLLAIVAGVLGKRAESPPLENVEDTEA